MDNKIIAGLTEIVGPANVYKNENMSRHTTFRCGGDAEVLITPDAASIQAAVQFCKDEKVPFTILGNGSNVLVGDKGIKGVVIEISKAMSDIKVEGNLVTAEAGAMLASIAQAAAANSLTGLEFASGIPGSLGGACVMNAGAYDGEMKQVLRSVTVLTADGEIKVMDASELDLSYRHSAIMDNGSIVISAVMELKPGNADDIYAYMKELNGRRIDKQPLEYPSAGSTFKRPEGYFAGKLIQDSGLRGYMVGGAQVSEKHCGFVINRDNATAADVRQLMEDVQRIVFEKFGVHLEAEVRFLGEF